MEHELSETELSILEYLWEENEPKSFSEIMNYFNTICQKGWKKQTINTFLLRLIKKGVLTANKAAAKTLYQPTVTCREYYQNYSQQIIEEYFDGSILNFVSAFTDNQKLSAEEKTKLLNYIKEL